jgi:hypothetical protein
MILVAALSFYLAWPLDSFSSFGLGPGYIPKALALLLVAFGVAILIHGFLGTEESVERWHLRPLLLVLGSIVFFGLTVEAFGLWVAVIGLVLIASAAHGEARPLESAALAVGMAAFSFFVFIKGLGLTIPVWPSIAWGS